MMNASENQTNEKALSQLIAQEVATNPVALDGYMWCALPQPEVALRIGASVATVRRITGKPPFVRQQKQVNGIKRQLIREGVPGPLSPRHAANVMAKIWRGRLATRLQSLEEELAQMKKQVAQAANTDAQSQAQKRIEEIEQEKAARKWSTTRREYGCMNGLAEVWPQGHQPEIFGMVLTKWDFFMEGVKWAMCGMEEEGETPTKHYYRYPSIAVIRRFAHVALEMVEMEAQSSGKAVPPWVKAMNPHLWKAVKASK